MATDRGVWAFVSCREQWQSFRDALQPSLQESVCPDAIRRLYRTAYEKHRELADLFSTAPNRDHCIPIQGVVRLSVGARYQGPLSPGWSDKAFFMNEFCFDLAQDAYILQVQESVCLPTWEERLFVTSAEVPMLRKRTGRIQTPWVQVGIEKMKSTKKKALALKMLTVEVGGKGYDVASDDAIHRLSQLHVFDPSAGRETFQTLGSVVTEDLSQLPIIRVPSMVAFLLFCGSWSQVVMLARWTRLHFPNLCEGLPHDWLEAVKDCHRQPAGTVTGELLNLDGINCVMNVLRRLGEEALLSSVNEDDRVGLHLELSNCLALLRAHARTLDVSFAVKSQKALKGSVPSDVFVQQVLVSLDLRDRNMLKAHAERFSACLPEVFRPLLDAWLSNQVLSGASLYRGRIFLDIALQLTHRMRLSNLGETWKYAWGDSSSKWGLEIYNSRYRWLLKSKSVELARAWRFLCNNPWHEDLDDHIAQKRQQCSHLLFDCIELHTQVPQCLGNKRTALSDKVSCHVHAALLESLGLDDLEQNFNNHVSWCSDLGVESGLPGFCSAGAETVLPSWLQPARVEVVASDTDFIEDGAVVAQQPVLVKPLMPAAFPIPGVCHAVHNAIGNLEKAFPWYEEFVARFKTLYQFLGSKQRRDRFVEMVMKGKLQYTHAKKLFGKEVPSFYTERWNAFMECLEATWPLAEFLRVHWDDVRYAEGEGHVASVEDGWKPKDLNAILDQPFFFAYWQLQLLLRRQIANFQSWAEGCSCHSIAKEEDSQSSKMTLQQLLRTEIQCPSRLPCRCPMMGCQAPFLARNHVSKLSDDLTRAFQDFVIACCERLKPDQWSTLLQEWHHGCSVFVESLRTRLGCYLTFPWVLLAGTHPNVKEARAGLKVAMQLWEDLPVAARNRQHAHVQSLFQNPALFGQLKAFVDSDSDLDTFPALEEFLAPFTFVQVAERIIEAAHKDLGQTRPKHFSMNLLSVTMRLPELDRYLSKDPEHFGVLVEAFSQARHLNAFAELFPCHMNHPKLLALGNCKKAARYVPFASEALYRDADVQFADNKDATAVHAEAAKQRDKENNKYKPKPTVSEAGVLAHAAVEAIRDAASECPGEVFSVKQGGEGLTFFTPVLLSPSLLRQPLHAPCTVKQFSSTDMVISKLENRGSTKKPCVSIVRSGPAEVLSLKPIIDDIGVDAFLAGLCLWSKSGKLKYSLPLLGGRLHALLAEMIDHGALPHVKRHLTLAEDQAEAGSVPLLKANGYIEEFNEGWLLTPKCLKHMEFYRDLSTPKPFAKPVDLALGDMSLLHLLFTLHEQGWTWSLLTSKQKAEGLEYKVGGDLVWRTSGVTVSAHYLRCLLEAHRLDEEHGIKAIPHGLSGDAYELILGGMLPSDAVRKVQQKKRKAEAPKLLTDVDVDTGVSLLHPQPLEVELLVPPQPLVDDLPLPGDGGSQSPMSLPSQHSEVGDVLDGNSPELASEPPLPPPAAPPPAVPHAEVLPGPAELQEALAVQSVASWGTFRFSTKQPHSAPPHGGYEATCRYHRKSTVTGCKKFVRLDDATEAAKEKALLALQHWCNMAPRFTRQRDHLRMSLKAEDVPPPDVVLCPAAAHSCPTGADR